MEGKDPSLAIAERLAVFFLQHPAVQEVQLFGSIAMWGMGDDVDLVLVVPDDTARQFLVALRDASQELDRYALEQEELYGLLKAFRNSYAFQLLGWQEDKAIESQKICWAGMWTLWNKLMGQWRSPALFEEDSRSSLDQAHAAASVNHAADIDVLYHHEYDLFMMPQGWQTSGWVEELLPTWPSKRPFGTIPSFRDVIAWQARSFDSAIGEFIPHQPHPNASREKLFRELRRREHIGWSLRHREMKLLWAQDAQANQ